MMAPVITEPADTPPVTMGEVKEPEEKPATEPKVPADTTPPTVVEVAWYSDWQMTKVLTMDSTVRPGDTIYTVVSFSEPVVHTVADDSTARPALLIVTDGMEEQYRMLQHKVRFKSGEAKPLRDGTDTYLCKYTIPADTVGTITLRVDNTADLAGNTAEMSEHIAPFVLPEPVMIPEPEEPGQMTLTLPPGYTLPPELIPTEPTVLSTDEQSLIEAMEKIGWDATAVRPSTTNSPADMISLLPVKDREEVYNLFVASVDLPHFAEAAQKMKEVNITLISIQGEWRETGDSTPYFTFLDAAEKERGLPAGFDLTLEWVYFEERPEDLPYEDGNSKYWMILEWYRLQLVHPEINLNIRLFDLLDIYRKSCRKGNIFGLNNPWS